MNSLQRKASKLLACWGFMLLVALVPAQHDLDALFGYQAGTAKVMQPAVQPIRQMSHPPGLYLADVGLDFFTPDGWSQPMLQECRVLGTYISPNLIGSKTGVGNIFCAGGCDNFFDLPYAGTPHHHLKFTAPDVAAVYVWDIKVVNAVDYLGNPLNDMPNVYRYYMVAGTPNKIRGSVSPAPQYVGDLGKLTLRLELRSGGSTMASQELPVCSGIAVYPYMVGFTQSGTFDVVAKLSKHLSVRLNGVTLIEDTHLDWAFPYVGDLDGDDSIGLGDLNRVLVNFGTSNDAGDVNGDGTVALDDLNTVLLNFGRSGQGL